MAANILQEEQNKYWTNGQTIGKVVYLGINDSPSNWWKITEAEKQELERLAEQNEEEPLN